jgi:hypothetical protein
LLIRYAIIVHPFGGSTVRSRRGGLLPFSTPISRVGLKLVWMPEGSDLPIKRKSWPWRWIAC